METTDGGIGTITFLDLFSGIGAFRLGLERACASMGLAARCLGFSEIDGPAIATYLRNFPGTPQLGDVRSLARSRAIPRCDVILAGFPCQDASSAGRRLGLQGERGRLFYALAAAIRAVRPGAYLLENVSGLATLDGGIVLQTILSTLKALGYDVRHAILNSRDFGVPQNRPRIYFAGILGEGSFRFPAPADSSKRLKDVLEDGPVPACHYLTEKSLKSLRAHKARHEAKGNGFGFSVIDPSLDVAGTLMASNWGREKNIIVDGRGGHQARSGGNPQANREHIRRLTPIEWERLQGLPDGFTAGQADGHRYRQLGNAVTVSVIEALARNLLASLRRDDPRDAPAIFTPKTAEVASPVSLTLTSAEICAGRNGEAP
jgi:DNA (cytosine-5)-methyltransferase 1